ncbi:MAG TPA: type I-C CRISPR-associated protein Cas8c/Csd1, partial [Kofleriaceae bacterium]|nr:type I-C CRISPR-associated protein Cas8c/Csd1 [Kofleriaceae bacterium]
MLRSLVALAEREGLVEDPAFEERRVDFEIRLDAEGRYEALISLRDEKGRGKRMSVPRSPPKRTVAVAAGLLVDNAKYVLGIGTPGKDRPERLEQCQEAFLARLADALRASKDPALQAAHRFCSNGSDYRAAILGDRPASEWT